MTMLYSWPELTMFFFFTNWITEKISLPPVPVIKQLNLIPATGIGVINRRVVEVTLINTVAGPYIGAFSHEAVAALPPGSDYDFSNGCRAIYCFLGSCSEHGICC
jgi:hypothetical protein